MPGLRDILDGLSDSEKQEASGLLSGLDDNTLLQLDNILQQSDTPDTRPEYGPEYAPDTSRSWLGLSNDLLKSMGTLRSSIADPIKATISDEADYQRTTGDYGPAGIGLPMQVADYVIKNPEEALATGVGLYTGTEALNLGSKIPVVGSYLSEPAAQGLGFLGRNVSRLGQAFLANFGFQAGRTATDILTSPEDARSDLKEAGDAIVPAMNVQTLLNYGVPLLVGGAGDVGRYLRGEKFDLANRAAALNSNPGYAKPSGTASLSNEDALKRLNGTGIVDKSVLSSENPIGQVYDNLKTAKQSVGQQIENTVDNLPGGVVGKNLKASNVIEVPDVAAGGTGSTLESVVGKEDDAILRSAFNKDLGQQAGAEAMSRFDAVRNASNATKSSSLFQKHPGAELPDILSESEYAAYNAALDRGRELSQKVALAAEAESKGVTLSEKVPKEAEKLLPFYQEIVDGTHDVIDARILGELAKADATGSSALFSPAEVQGLKQQYGELANWKGGEEAAYRAQQYQELYNNAKNRLQILANRAGIGPQFRNLNSQYEAIATLQPRVAETVGQQAVSGGTRSSEIIGASVGSNFKPRFYGRAAEYFSGKDPNSLLRRSFGQLPQQRIGEAVGSAQSKFGTAEQITQAQNLIRSIDTAQKKGYDLENPPPESVAAAPAPLGVSLSVQKATPPIANGIPRNLNTINPTVVSQLLLNNTGPAAIPYLQQLQRAIATGDRMKIGEVLGAISSDFPQFPFQGGQVTGLPSEFDIGDGNARLFAEPDRYTWEDRIKNSDLREDEKAVRVWALRKHKVAYPLESRLLQDSPGSPAPGVGINNYKFAPREKNAFGSRKVEN